MSCTYVIDRNCMGLRANQLMKQNIAALLQKRGLRPHDLAQWCRRSDSWFSKIMAEDRREFPMKYWDRISDFLGVDTFRLLQPGISRESERRKGGERRSGKDRRVSRRSDADQQLTMQASDLSLTAGDVAHLLRLRSLAKRDRVEVERLAREAWRLRRIAEPSTIDSPVGEDSGRGKAPPTRPRQGTRSKPGGQDTADDATDPPETA